MFKRRNMEGISKKSLPKPVKNVSVAADSTHAALKLKNCELRHLDKTNFEEGGGKFCQPFLIS
jgi:hypothetical protein